MWICYFCVEEGGFSGALLSASVIFCHQSEENLKFRIPVYVPDLARDLNSHVENGELLLLFNKCSPVCHLQNFLGAY